MRVRESTRERLSGVTRLYRVFFPRNTDISAVGSAPEPTWTTVIRCSWLTNHDRTRSSSLEVWDRVKESQARKRMHSLAESDSYPPSHWGQR